MNEFELDYMARKIFASWPGMDALMDLVSRYCQLYPGFLEYLELEEEICASTDPLWELHMDKIKAQGNEEIIIQ
jgi:hypothetical protein